MNSKKSFPDSLFDSLKQSFNKIDNLLVNSKLPGFLKNKYILLSILALLFVIFIGSLGSTNPTNGEIPTYKVKKDNFVISLSESGEIRAKKSYPIITPRVRREMKITYLIPEGTIVEPGDTILRFDQTETLKTLKDAKEELELKISEKEKLLAEQKSKTAQDEATLEEAELSLKLSKLELERSKFEATTTQEKNKLSFRKSELSFKKTKEQIESSKIIRQTELAKLETELRQKQDRVQKVQEDVDLLTVTAPSPGLIVYELNWANNRKFQIGDAPWPGQPILKLPDLTKMQSTTYVNEVNVSLAKVGQKVDVILDAFQDTVFIGKITNIAHLGKNKSQNNMNVKVFDIMVDIEGSSDMLKPGLSTRNRIIIDEIPNVFFVPLEAVMENDEYKFVYIKDGNSFEEREVVTGRKGEDFIEIKSGLEDGDLVALINPNSLEENDESNASTTSEASL